MTAKYHEPVALHISKQHIKIGGFSLWVQVWLSCLGCVIIYGFMFWITTFFSPYYAVFTDPSDATHGARKITNAITYIYGSFLQQGMCAGT